MSDRCNAMLWVPEDPLVDADGEWIKERIGLISNALDKNFPNDFDVNVIDATPSFRWINLEDENDGANDVVSGMIETEIPFVLFHGAGSQYPCGIHICLARKKNDCFYLELSMDGTIVAPIGIRKGIPKPCHHKLRIINRAILYAKAFNKLYGAPNCDIFKELIQ